jgi:transcriptional regulator with XRE-family HTH domain
MSLIDSIGKNFKEWRIENKLSQEAVASKVGISRTTITNIETSTQNPTLEFICKVYEEYNIDLIAG